MWDRLQPVQPHKPQLAFAGYSALRKKEIPSVHVLREATPADANAISSLLRVAFQEFESQYTPEAFIASVPPDAHVLARLEEGPLWVAERQSSLIGTVAAACARDSVLVRGMAVHPSARGLGLGRILLEQTENFARRHGRERLSLYTTAFLKGAIHLYQMAGFHFTGETANPHGVKLLRMEKILAE
jgi:putative acetyltransferase